MTSGDRVELFVGKPPLFSLRSIKNRRFMFCAQTGEMILGGSDVSRSSHGDEHYQARPKADYPAFVRGWVGYGRSYPHGIIHFAPGYKSEELRYDAMAMGDIVATLHAFVANGATADTILRGAGAFSWEVPLGRAYPEVLCARTDAAMSARDGSYPSRIPSRW